MHKDIFFLFSILLIVAITTPKKVWAWGAHKEITYYSIKDIEWINGYGEIKITPYTYTDNGGENPKYTIPYKEGNIGDVTDALTILTTYSEEPDWELDKNIDSLLFKGMRCIGLDSSHWRHGYWIIWEGFIELGGAIERILHYTEMSLLAFRNKDPYWGFRFLARSIHYLEDITQPQHTSPVISQVMMRYLFDINQLILVASNHHFALEGYQGYNLKIGYSPFVDAIILAEPVEVRNLGEFSRDAALKSKKEAPRLWELQSKLYGEKIDEPKDFYWFPGIEYNKELKAQYDELIIKQLSDLSSRVKGLVIYVGKILEGLPYTVLQGDIRFPSKNFVGSFITKGYTSHFSLSRRIINHRKISPRGFF
jgi:hypothetical protein